RQGAGTHAAFMPAAVHLRLDAHIRAAAHVQGTDALGPVDLVRRKRHQVHRQLSYIDNNLADTLGGIDVKENFLFTAQCTDIGDVVDHTGFVIGMHDRHQSGVRPQYRTHIVGTDYTIRTRRQPAHLIAFALEKTHAVDHRLVLGSGRDQMTTTGLARLRRALDRQVVGFGGATGPDDFAWVGIYQVGDLAARVFHRFLGKPAIHVRTRGRIAENAIHAQ